MTGARRTAVFLALACVAPLSARAADGQIPRSEGLIVRIYDPQMLVGDRLAAASETAGEILRDAGMSVVWRHCDLPPVTPGPVDDPCQLPVATNHLVVRITSAPAAAVPHRLGFSYIDRSPSRSWLATVFGDRLNALADRMRLRREVLIGRAMAHELGHLLLDSPAHSKHGFMQPAWTDAMLLRNRGSDWQFTPREAAQIRTGALERSRALTPDLLARRDE